MQSMAQERLMLSSYDAYFNAIQSRKKLPQDLQEALTTSFAKIPVSSFPELPRGQVIEISADTSIAEAVKVLSENNIMSAPVTNPDARDSQDWRERYLGILDYSAIILWVLENAELAAVALTTGSVTAAGVGAGAVGALGALAIGVTGPVAGAGLTVAAVGAAVAGAIAGGKGMVADAPAAANHLGEDFYRVLVTEEPFKSAQVKSIVKSFRWAPFLPVSLDSSMLSVMLLLSKYRMRNVPVVKPGEPSMKNFITQSAVIQGLKSCKGRDWFDAISSRPLSDLGLPFMSPDEVICINHDALILQAFKLMKENEIGGLPVVQGPEGKVLGNLSLRDIRFLLLEPDLFSSFRQLTAIDFMKTVVEINQDLGIPQMMPPITCKADSSLWSVIENLSSRKVYRIYVVDDNDCVCGVVTLRDVISCFIFEPPNHFDNYFGFAVMEMLDR